MIVHVVVELVGNEVEVDGAEVLKVFADLGDAEEYVAAQPRPAWLEIKSIQVS